MNSFFIIQKCGVSCLKMYSFHLYKASELLQTKLYTTCRGGVSVVPYKNF